MASTFISALVVETNNSVLFNPDGTLGQIQAIPTPGAGGSIDGDFWAVPVTEGVVGTGFNYVPTTPNDTTKPDAQAFHVVRISSNASANWWYIVGVSTNGTNGYIEASNDAECCAADPAQMPTDVPNLAGCQFICSTDSNGNYVAYFGLPTLQGSLTRYFPYGYLNGEALTEASAAGYSTLNALIAFLNSNWNVGGGSPAASISWSFTPDGLTLIATETNGTGEDYICAQVIAINPSA